MLLSNPKVTVKDYMQYFNCSEPTAKRARAADRIYAQTILKHKFPPNEEGEIHLDLWLKIYSTPPLSLQEFVTNN